MSLSAGDSLGHYRIRGPLGAGAMGEVWLAEDTRLGRDVAIKVLPEPFVRDAERLRRFEREAKSLAALNHPSVAQIFGVDQVGDTHFLVLELVPGQTLEERLQRGALPLDEALDLCRQIAEGLEAAHEAGVIHRDLKPANVRLTHEGKVKLLDFGLAKPMRDQGDAAGSHDSGLSTEAGRLIGTPAYMAPEQARGRPIDKRVDLWAFGCVLYECLTGAKAFAGETLSDVLAAVLEREPDWSRLPAGTPPRVRELLEHCLAKDARQRWRDIGDVRLDLVRLQRGGAHMERRPRMRGAPLPAVALFFALGAALAAATFAMLSRPNSAPAARVRRFALYGSNLSVDSTQGLALCPEGRRVVYRGRNEAEHYQLYLHDLDSFESTPLAGTEQGYLPFFSPSGDELGFAAQGELRVIALASGVVRTLTAVHGFSGGAWLADGTIVWTGSTSRELQRVASTGGEPESIEVAGPDVVDFVVGPSPLPGGRAFLLGARSSAGFEAVVFDLEHRTLSRIAEGFTPAFAPGGYVLFQRGDGPLMAIAFDVERLAARGSPFPAVLDAAPRVSTQVRLFALAADGTLAYVPKSAFRDRGALVSVDRKGQAETLLDLGKPIDNPRFSHDGRKLAFRTPAAACELWVHDLESGVTTRITSDGDNHGNAWMPDDAHIAFLRVGRNAALMLGDASGGADPSAVLEIESPFGFASSCAPDGRHMLLGMRNESGADLFVADLESHSARPLLATRFSERAGAFSPGGSCIAYVSDEEGQDEVYVQSFPALDARRKISVDGGTDPVWSRDGRELFFLAGRSLMSVAVTLDPSFASGRPEVLFDSDILEGWNSGLASYDVSPDGQRFVMIRQHSDKENAEIHVVLDWLSELNANDPQHARR